MVGKALARNEDIVVQKSGNELLIYDLTANKAYCLNETCAMIWRLCDGTSSVAEIGGKISKWLNTPIRDEFVWLALDQLNRDGLLQDYKAIESEFAGLSRREVAKKIGFASIVALPVISSIVAPKAVMAQSTLLGLCSPCTLGSDCASGTCANFSSLCSPGPGLGFPPGAGWQSSLSCASQAITNCCSGSATQTGTTPTTNICACD